MNNDAKVFWAKVTYYMKLKGYTNIDLAERTGIKYQSLKNLRSLNRLPNLADACLIAEALNISIDAIMELNVTRTAVSEEVMAVENDPEIRYIVRLCKADSSLVHIVTSLLQRTVIIENRRAE